MDFLTNYVLWETRRSFVCTFIYCVGAGRTTLIPLSDGLGLYILRRKTRKMRPMREKWMETCSFPARAGGLSFVAYCDKITLPCLYLDLGYRQLCFATRKRYK